MAKSFKEGTAANQRRSGSEGHRFKSWCQQGLFTAEIPLQSTGPLDICIYNIHSGVRCIGCLYICLTCERCYMCSINKGSPEWRQPLKKAG